MKPLRRAKRRSSWEFKPWRGGRGGKRPIARLPTLTESIHREARYVSDTPENPKICGNLRSKFPQVGGG